MKDGSNWIALDAMGGDGAPRINVEGAIEAIERHQIPVRLVGPTKLLRREVGRFKALPEGLDLVEAPDVIGMDESPVVVLRSKKNSSLSICAQLVQGGHARAMVTAGNTGAAWLAAKSNFDMIPGIDRPALAAISPRRQGQTLLLDVGANVECTPQQLVSFAVMGSLYAQFVLGVENPSVGLMSVGAEEGKGGAKVREHYRVLANTGVRFVGNVEGGDVFSGEVDVIVTDGFTGNVILKVAEGMGEMVINAIKDEARQSPVYGVGLLVAKGAFRNLRKRVDYSEYGGAPLLGVKGPCLIGHGRSSAKAIRNAIRFAASYASSGVIERIGEKVSEVLDQPGRSEDD